MPGRVAVSLLPAARRTPDPEKRADLRQLPSLLSGVCLSPRGARMPRRRHAQRGRRPPSGRFGPGSARPGACPDPGPASQRRSSRRSPLSESGQRCANPGRPVQGPFWCRRPREGRHAPRRFGLDAEAERRGGARTGCRRNGPGELKARIACFSLVEQMTALSGRPWRVVFAAGVLLLPRALTGQPSTGEEISERSLLPRAEIDQAMAESRFRLGPVSISPEIAIRDATYDNNIYGTSENPTGDFRTTVLAGVGLILPVGKNVFLRASAFPEYTWYAQLAERRFFGGNYGGSVRLFANRLTLEASGDYSKTDVLFSSEVQTRAIQELDTFRLGAELRVLPRLFVYGEGQLQQFRYSGPGAEQIGLSVSTTDRTTQLVLGEVRYRWNENVRLAAGYEETRAEFVSLPQQYDNVTRTVVGTVYYDREKLFVKVSGGYSEEKPIHGSTILPF